MSARKLASAKRVQEKKQKRLQKLKRKQSGSSFDSSCLYRRATRTGKHV